MLRLSLRMTGRDWRAGQLRFLLVALIVAVAALSAVGFFVDRLRAGLSRDAHQLLGADLVINADQPPDPAWRAEAARRGLRGTETVSFASMAQAGQGEQSLSQLASLKAVSAGYPLRGRLKITDSPEQAGAGVGQPTDAVPAPGTVWVDANLLPALQVGVGATIRLGEREFRIARLIAAEPDRGASFLNFAPRVMLPLDQLESTGLVQDGSRATYRLLLAAAPGQPDDAIKAYQAWLQGRIERAGIKGVRIESLESGRPEMQSTLVRADRFLSLVGLLSAMLAAVAVAMAARRFMLRHLDACAMLRCLGLTQNQVSLLYLTEFLLVGLAGSALGVALGYAGHAVLLELLGKLVQGDLPPVSWRPAAQGLAVGMLLLVGFALPPILQLRNVPHNRVIRREAGAPQPLALAGYGLGLGTFLLLLFWQAGDAQLALLTGAGFLGGCALFALAGWLGLKSLKRLRGAINSQSWRFALTSLRRRPGATVVQIVALALGLMALLLLSVVRADLMQAWRSATPADAPNRFVINILPGQPERIAERLRRAGVRDAPLYPMVRGRLSAVNGVPVTAATYTEDRARNLAEREFNLSSMSQMQPENKIVAGRWFAQTAPQAGGASADAASGAAASGVSSGAASETASGAASGAASEIARGAASGASSGAPGGAFSEAASGASSGAASSASSGAVSGAAQEAEASVEEGIAKTLRLKLGDRLRFDVAGQPVEARVTSLRKLEWGSMRVNFFVILNQAALADAPRTWITAFHLNPAQAELGNALTREFPNLTVIDVGGVLRQVQAVLDQVVVAVEFLFAFTLAAGVLVLYAALMGSQDERSREAALLRALGATRRQLARAQMIEFSLVGALAGALAASGAAALGWALATYQFKFAWSFAPGVWVLGLAGGALCALAGGWLGLRQVLRRPPLQTLRDA